MITFYTSGGGPFLDNQTTNNHFSQVTPEKFFVQPTLPLSLNGCILPTLFKKNQRSGCYRFQVQALSTHSHRGYDMLQIGFKCRPNHCIHAFDFSRVVENGQETVMIEEDGVLKSKSINGVPQALDGPSSKQSIQA